MSRKKTQPDEIETMGKVYLLLREFSDEQRARMLNWVSQRIAADKPRKRVRRKAAQYVPAPMVNGTITSMEPICVDAFALKGLA